MAGDYEEWYYNTSNDTVTGSESGIVNTPGSASGDSGVNWAAVGNGLAGAYGAYNQSQAAAANQAAASDPANQKYGYRVSEGGGENSSQISYEGRATRNQAYDILSQLLGSNQYSRSNAIADTQGAIAEIFKQYSITDLPKIYNSQIGMGAYNSTSHQLMANEAFANATAKGAALRNQAILNYAQARNNELNPLISLLNADRENFGMEFSSSQEENFGGLDMSAMSAANTQAATADTNQAQAWANLFAATQSPKK